MFLYNNNGKKHVISYQKNEVFEIKIRNNLRLEIIEKVEDAKIEAIKKIVWNFLKQYRYEETNIFCFHTLF